MRRLGVDPGLLPEWVRAATGIARYLRQAVDEHPTRAQLCDLAARAG
jgi:hypothetical protein